MCTPKPTGPLGKTCPSSGKEDNACAPAQVQTPWMQPQPQSGWEQLYHHCLQPRASWYWLFWLPLTVAGVYYVKELNLQSPKYELHWDQWQFYLS